MTVPRPAALRRAAVAAALAVVAGVARGGPDDGPRFGTVTTVPVPRGQAVRAAILADVDGDGRDDLVVSTRRPGRRAGRMLRVHLRKAGDAAFSAEADAVLDVYEDVVAFAVADVDPEPGAEVVLFTANAVHAWRTRASEDRKTVRLLSSDFLFQAADPKEVFPFEAAVRDVDGDGLPDLVVPEPDGWRVALQRRAEGVTRFDPPSVLHVPDDQSGEPAETPASRKVRARATRKRIRVAIQVGEGEVPGDLLSVHESVPAAQVADFDGDGRLDVIAQTPHQLHVWLQKDGGTFSAAPDASYDLPFAADRKRRLDVSYSAQTADVDGDRRADAVFFAGDKETDAVRTQVLVYTQRGGGAGSPLFHADGIPDQLLNIAGFAGSPRLIDVDGDGRPDLTAGSMRLDALDAVAAAAKGTLDAELYVWRNVGGRFSKTPDLDFPVSVRAEGLRHRGEGVLARFVADATGDGVRDLLLRDEPTNLELLMVRRTKDGLAVAGQPLWETHVADGAKVQVVERPGAPPEILIVEDSQVRHVRFP